VRLKDDAAAAKVYEGTTPLTAEDIANTAYWIATSLRMSTSTAST
jgi:serine 3-dehydrogenase/3-hydroxy acid dehydrogenase/malonic semialdehyde reductase